ncbi:hypothetical protein RclHR1_31830002 [Rhizophagus clarus]|uniref:Paired domain-containing protein n=1 Tax=Rhizophagus clarus TaxID=94130 RepID=A0A2Z6RMA0_9GLOM|nr:hypothetical protein RclHR1_31830002 [Rhizophagus clarus]
MLKLNEHLRWLIVERVLEGVSCRRIAEQLNISKTSVSRIFLNFRKYGCVEDLSHLRGRSRIFSVDDTKYLENLLKEKLTGIYGNYNPKWSCGWAVILVMAPSGEQLNVLDTHINNYRNQQKSVMK